MQSNRSSARWCLVLGSRACCILQPGPVSRAATLSADAQQVFTLLMWEAAHRALHRRSLGRRWPDWQGIMQLPLLHITANMEKLDWKLLKTQAHSALKGTKLGQCCSFPHHVPDLRHTALMVPLQPSHHSASLMRGSRCCSTALMQTTWTHLGTLAPSVSWYCTLITWWVNQKGCKTLNYSWAKMTARLMNLSGLTLLLGGNLQPFEYLCDCSHYHLPRGFAPVFPWGLSLCTVDVLNVSSVRLPAPLAKPHLRILRDAGSSSFPARIPNGQYTHTHLLH